MRPLIALLCLLSSSVMLGQARQSPAPEQERPAILQRFLSRSDAPLRTYRAWRRLEARNERLSLSGWMEVRTELVNATTLLWNVVAEGGAESIRGRVLRKALQAEAEALRTGDPAAAALTADNYTFTPADEPAPDAGYRVLIHPRRQDRLLLRGSMLIREADAELIQVEGRLARSPSFWTSAVDVVRRYARVQGVRVPIEMMSTARVKIAGLSSFRMTWDYEAVNGVPVGEGGR